MNEYDLSIYRPLVMFGRDQTQMSETGLLTRSEAKIGLLSRKRQPEPHRGERRSRNREKTLRRTGRSSRKTTPSFVIFSPHIFERTGLITDRSRDLGPHGCEHARGLPTHPQSRRSKPVGARYHEAEKQKNLRLRLSLAVFIRLCSEISQGILAPVSGTFTNVLKRGDMHPGTRIRDQLDCKIRYDSPLSLFCIIVC